MFHEYFTSPGSFHLHRGSPNEDRVLVSCRDGLTSAAICDGAGSFDFGSDAAEVVCKTITELFHTRFEMLFCIPTTELREILVRTVEDALREYSRICGIRENELACTILAAAVHEDGRCLCIHLGDGIILQKNTDDHSLSVVSCPMTGLAPHSTYLTMNCDLHRYLRVYRWESAALEQLLLLSDGAAEHLFRLQGGDGWVYSASAWDIHSIHTLLRTANPRDDHSVLLITR